MKTAYQLAAVAIVVVAAALRFWALDMGLPHPLTRPDEEMIVAHSVKPAQGQPDLDWAVYPSAYVYLNWLWGTVGLRAATLLGVFPPGDYLAAVRAHPERVILVDRVLSATAGTATVAVLMAVARPALGAGPALAAGALLATNFLHARDSHGVKPEALLTLAVVAALGLAGSLAQRPTPGRAVRLGVAVGVAMAMKYPGVVLLVPAALAAVLGSPRRGWQRLVPGTAVIAATVAGLVFVATSPWLFINPRTRTAMLGIVNVVFPQLMPAAPLPPGVAPPPATWHWWDGLGYHLAFSLRWGMGLLPTLLAPAALLWAAIDRRPLAVCAAAFALAYYLVMGASIAMLARYMTPLVPVLFLLEAGLLGALARRFVPARWAALALAVATAVIGAESAARTVAHDRIASRTDTRVLATRWMEANLRPGTRVAILGTHLWPYGVPLRPPGVEAVTVESGDEAVAAGAGYLLAHDHPLPFSHVAPGALDGVARRLRLLAEFDSFAPGRRSVAAFETSDAYYIPFHGFPGVTRPGPTIRIYAIGGS